MNKKPGRGRSAKTQAAVDAVKSGVYLTKAARDNGVSDRTLRHQLVADDLWIRPDAPGKVRAPANSATERACAMLITRERWTPKEFMRAMAQMVETKQQALRLAANLRERGYIERQIVSTEKARQRVAT